MNTGVDADCFCFHTLTCAHTLKHTSLTHSLRPHSSCTPPSIPPSLCRVYSPSILLGAMLQSAQTPYHTHTHNIAHTFPFSSSLSLCLSVSVVHTHTHSSPSEARLHYLCRCQHWTSTHSDEAYCLRTFSPLSSQPFW